MPNRRRRQMTKKKTAAVRILMSCILLAQVTDLRARSFDARSGVTKWPTHGWAKGKPSSVGLDEEPGNVFNYSSGVSELLAYIFQKETGQDVEKYGEKYLFTPLGIKHYWKRTPMGVVDTEGGLFLNTTDLAKIGYLYLHDCIWDRKQI